MSDSSPCLCEFSQNKASESQDVSPGHSLLNRLSVAVVSGGEHFRTVSKFGGCVPGKCPKKNDTAEELWGS